MQEEKFVKLLDEVDRDLDAFPFWASFKKACAAHAAKNVQKITPGRQALLILWQASSQKKDINGNLVSIELGGEMMKEKLETLKSELIGHFMNEQLDDYALNRFFKSVNQQVDIN